MARPRIRGVQNDLSGVSLIDWARLAAYIDGEGHIAINQEQRGYQYIRIVVTNTDPRLIAWLLTTFGGGVMKGKPQSERHRKVYKWSASCRHAEALLRAAQPFFITKRDQAEIALAFQDTLAGYRKGNNIPESVTVLRSSYRDQLRDARHVPHAELMRDEHGNVTNFTH